MSPKQRRMIKMNVTPRLMIQTHSLDSAGDVDGRDFVQGTLALFKNIISTIQDQIAITTRDETFSKVYLVATELFDKAKYPLFAGTVALGAVYAWKQYSREHQTEYVENEEIKELQIRVNGQIFYAKDSIDFGQGGVIITDDIKML